MLVHQILNSKSNHDVATVLPEATVADAVEVLASRRIGALVVSVDGKVALGILSERDVMRELGRRGPACLTETVEAMMTRDLVGCTRDDTADVVLQQMTDGRFRHMPVIEAGQMVGLISIGDVVKARLLDLAAEKDALEGMIKGF